MSRQLILLLLVVVVTCDEEEQGSPTLPTENEPLVTNDSGNFSTNAMPDRPYRDVNQFGVYGGNEVTRLRDHKDLWDCRPFPQIVYFDPDPEGKTYSIPAVRIDKCGSAWLKKGITCDVTNQEIVTYESFTSGGSYQRRFRFGSALQGCDVCVDV
uniref:Uncharacterized protein n=1 Tax=Cacopsylla melanoneura TaxID=428564 RepID=A0A8D8X2V6_9HEMI